MFLLQLRRTFRLSISCSIISVFVSATCCFRVFISRFRYSHYVTVPEVWVLFLTSISVADSWFSASLTLKIYDADLNCETSFFLTQFLHFFSFWGASCESLARSSNYFCSSPSNITTSCVFSFSSSKMERMCWFFWTLCQFHVFRYVDVVKLVLLVCCNPLSYILLTTSFQFFLYFRRPF